MSRSASPRRAAVSRSGCGSHIDPHPAGYGTGVPRKVILDVDTGTDDAVAIMFAALHVGAVEFLVETLRSTTEQITLVPTGPLSNVAAALALEPRLAGAVHEVVIMG